MKHRLLFIIIALLLLSSCESVKPSSHSSDSLMKFEKVYIHTKDSIYIDRWHDAKTINDTTYIYDSVTKFVYKYKTDTVARDSVVYKDKLVEKVVEVRRYPLLLFSIVLSVLAILILIYNGRTRKNH